MDGCLGVWGRGWIGGGCGLDGTDGRGKGTWNITLLHNYWFEFVINNGTLLVVVVDWMKMEHLVYHSCNPCQVEGTDCDQQMIHQRIRMWNRLTNTEKMNRFELIRIWILVSFLNAKSLKLQILTCPSFSLNISYFL